MRPLGAIVLGAYGDRAGRKASLMVSILLMVIGTLMTALMPSYATIGILAPIAVLLARLIQGFSVGGEFGSATAFLVEHGPAARLLRELAMGRARAGGAARLGFWRRAHGRRSRPSSCNPGAGASPSCLAS